MKFTAGRWEFFLGDFAPPRLCVWPAELVPARARARKPRAKSARSWSAVVLYRFSWARGLGVGQPLARDDTSTMPKRQRTGALQDAGARPQAPFPLTPRFSGVMGVRERNSTGLTVSLRAWRKRCGKSARLCRRFPTCCVADFQSAGPWTNPKPLENTQSLRIGNPRYSRLEVCGTRWRASTSALPINTPLQRGDGRPGTQLNGFNRFASRVAQASRVVREVFECGSPLPRVCWGGGLAFSAKDSGAVFPFRFPS